MIAYHGTTKENASRICSEGFSQDLQGQNGSHFGDGIYLTTTKKRAKLYGKSVLSIEVDASELAKLDNWYPDYMATCEAEYEKGIEAKKVNGVVGNLYKERYTSVGMKGILLAPLMGTGKELVIYDSSLIKAIWL